MHQICTSNYLLINNDRSKLRNTSRVQVYYKIIPNFHALNRTFLVIYCDYDLDNS